MIEEFGPRGNGYSGTPPENWRILPMRDVCSKVTDGTHDTPQVLDVGVPFITAIHVKNGKIDFANCSYLSAEDHADIFKRCNPERGDLTVVNIGAGVAECGAVDVDFEFSMKNVALLKPRADILDHQYLLQSHLQRKDRIAHAIKSGGAQPFMSLTEIRKLPIAVPPIPEQRRIAEILSTWDRAIEATEKLIANSEAQKKALMQQLLTGKKRLPGFYGEWKSARLDVLFNFKKGQGISKQAVCEDGEHSCVLYGELYTRYEEIIDEVVSRTNSNDGVPSLSGDLLVPASTTTSGIDLANVTAIGESGVKLGGDINILRMKKPNLSASFFAHYLTHVMKHDIASRAQGITIIHLYAAHLRDLEVQLPPVAEQEKISDVILTAAKEISSQKEKLQKLKAEKAALMQQLLTGKRRVAINKEDVA